jgi:NADH-quinone oxidoreductase subunit J
MIIAVIAFYAFAAIIVFSGVMVVTARNPVHSVLFLILAFFNAAGLFVLAGAEFLAMTLIFVYVGAVAVFFLFVVMMLDIDFAELRRGFARYLPIGGLVGLLLLVELVLLVGSWVYAPQAAHALTDPTPALAHVTNTEALGLVLYTKYAYLFEAVGFILLIAMVGAIVLTHREREASRRRQRIARQVGREAARAIEVRKVPVGRGIGS